MLNKELLMIQSQSQSYSSVYVTLRFFGGRGSGTYFYWTSPDGTLESATVFDERVEVVRTLTCKPNTKVMITTENYSGTTQLQPPQDIKVVEAPTDFQLTFTAFRDVEVSF